MADKNNPPEKGSDKGFLSRFLGFLGSIKFAVIVLTVITLSCIAGTFLSMELARRYVFSAGWFLFLLGLLGLSLLVCIGRRISIVLRSKGRTRGRAIGSVMTHISLLLVFAGGIVRARYGINGFLDIRKEETFNVCVVDGELHELPFAVHLADFTTDYYDDDKDLKSEKLLVYWKGSENVTILSTEEGKAQDVLLDGKNAVPVYSATIKKKIKDFCVDVNTREIKSRTDEFRNPAIKIEIVHQGTTNTQWLFALYPDFNMHHGMNQDNRLPFVMRYNIKVKDWISDVHIIEDGAVVMEKAIRVNHPLEYKGYRLYQHSVHPDDRTYSQLQIVKDPSVPLVYAGFLLMISGMAIMFLVYPSGATLRNVRNTKEQSK